MNSLCFFLGFLTFALIFPSVESVAQWLKDFAAGTKEGAVAVLENDKDYVESTYDMFDSYINAIAHRYSVTDNLIRTGLELAAQNKKYFVSRRYLKHIEKEERREVSYRTQGEQLAARQREASAALDSLARKQKID